MNDLPRVFANKISDNINKAQDVFYGSDREVTKKNTESVIKKINHIFASSDHVYKSLVKITTKEGTLEKVIVGKTNTNLITFNGELIKIIDIIDIEKI